MFVVPMFRFGHEGFLFKVSGLGFRLGPGLYGGGFKTVKQCL